MAVSMYMGSPLHGDVPDIAIDLFDKSLKNFAPSYLTHLLNQKVMNRIVDKSATYEITNGGNNITIRYTDGCYETLVYQGSNTYLVSGYSAEGILLEQVKTIFDETTGRITTQVTTDGSVNGIVPFKDATYEEIAIMLKRHYSGVINIADFWNIGDTRTVSYEAIAATSGVGETHAAMTQEVTIIGFNHDIMTGGGRAAVTLQVSNGIGNAGFMNRTNTNAGGWNDSNRRNWCNNAFVNSLEEGMRRLIKPVDKLTTNGNKSMTVVASSDKAFLLSESEYVGADVTRSVVNEGEQYDFYKNPAYRKKKQSDVVSGYDNHWTRSAAKNDAKQFVFIESDGDVNQGDASSEYRLLPAWAI